MMMITGKDIQLPDDDNCAVSKRKLDFKRVSKDCTVNDFGRHLLTVFDQFNVVALNGSLLGAGRGDLTWSRPQRIERNGPLHHVEMQCPFRLTLKFDPWDKIQTRACGIESEIV